MVDESQHPNSADPSGADSSETSARRSGRGWGVAFLLLITGMIVYGVIVATVIAPRRDSADVNAPQSSAPADDTP